MRKICVTTGSRADYGLLVWLMREIEQDSALQLQLVVTGSHLSHRFGQTFQEIEKDGFRIQKKVEILSPLDTKLGTTDSMARAVSGLANAYFELGPDILVVLGDRTEILSAVSAALILQIPVAHIHGGEQTQGAYDESIRHAVTKFSHFHFASAEPYRNRIIQLGEHPDRVFTVGAPAMDNIHRLKLHTKTEFERELDFTLGQRNILITFHPETLGSAIPSKDFATLLDYLSKTQNLSCIFTHPNADPNGYTLGEMVEKYCSKHPKTSISVQSMGYLNYLSSLQFVDAVVGNSSSGIIEAPEFRIGTINIGDRQRGRIKPPSVIDCDPNPESIRDAFKRLYSPEFRQLLTNFTNPYSVSGPNVGARIKEILKRVKLKGVVKKTFYDLNQKEVGNGLVQ